MDKKFIRFANEYLELCNKYKCCLVDPDNNVSNIVGDYSLDLEFNPLRLEEFQQWTDEFLNEKGIVSEESSGQPKS